MKQAKVAYFSWGKASEKQTETIEKQGEKQTKAIKKKFSHRSKINCFFVFKRFSKWKNYIWTEENLSNGKLNPTDITLFIKQVIRKKIKEMRFKKRFKKIGSFRREFFNNFLSLDDALELQMRLKDGIKKYGINIFKQSTKPKESFRKEKKVITHKNATILLNGKQKVLNAFESGMFPKGRQGKGLTGFLDGVGEAAKVSNCKRLKALTTKQMLQRLPIAVAQVKVDNESENLPNEIRLIIYCFYWVK